MWKEEVSAEIFQLMCLETRNSEWVCSPFESRQHNQHLSYNSWDMHCVSPQNMLTVGWGRGNELCWDSHGGITGLHPHISRHFAWQSSARGSQILRPSYLTYMIAAATYAGAYWHTPPLWFQKHTDVSRTNSRTLSRCDIRLGSLTSPALAAGDFVTLILL